MNFLNESTGKWIRNVAVFSKGKNLEAHFWEHISFWERNPAFFSVNEKQ